MMATGDAWIGIGSNLDGPAARVVAAFDALDDLPGSRLIARSPLYASSPIGPADQPDYVNAVGRVATALTSHELLDALQGIECASGRQRGGRRWGARVLDLDLLLFGCERLADERLRLPHPGIAERAFVLRPLADLAPALEVPGHGRVDALLAALPGNDVWPLAGSAA